MTIFVESIYELLNIQENVQVCVILTIINLPTGKVHLTHEYLGLRLRTLSYHIIMDKTCHLNKEVISALYRRV